MLPKNEKSLSKSRSFLLGGKHGCVTLLDCGHFNETENQNDIMLYKDGGALDAPDRMSPVEFVS